MNQEWRKDAKCLGLPVGLFFPQQQSHKEEVPREIRRLCMSCPVREECLDYALNLESNVGIWAATTPTQRAVIRKKRGIAFRKPIEHGTYLGYAMERRRGLKTCALCKQANARYQDERING